MKISTKGRYAVRLMYDLAMHHTGDWIALKDISRRQEISVKYLEQIVRQLSIRGYLKSLRGPKGGYQLSRDPKDYTIYEILKITEEMLYSQMTLRLYVFKPFKIKYLNINSTLKHKYLILKI